MSVALLCTSLLAWLARASVSPVCVLDCASACALEAFCVVILVFGLSISCDRGPGPTWPVVPSQASGFCVRLLGSVLVLCRLEPGCIALFLEWLPVLALSFPPLGHFVLAYASWSYHYRCGVAALPCLVLDHVVCRRWEVSGSGLTSDVFRVSVAVCHIVEHVTTRKVWLRPSGDSGCHFRVLRFLRVCLLSLSDRQEGLGVSRVVVGNHVLCRVFPATEWVADWLVPTVRSIGGCSRVVFGWRLPLFRPDLASLGT
ncbi:hypothetical protein Taro_055574, partial [Colocasia esculenta]|nr:hypothetical protein [Colocasia esculenta]